MIIKREVNGQVLEFELTRDELYGTYYEVEHIDDVMLMDIWFNGDGNLTEDQLERIADIYRSNVDDNDGIRDWRFDIGEYAVAEVLKEDGLK